MRTVSGIQSADRRPISPACPMTHFALILLISWSMVMSGPLVAASFCDDQDHLNLSALDDVVWNYQETAPIRNTTQTPGQQVNVTTETLFRFCRPLGNDSAPGCEGANVCVIRRMSNGTQIVDAYRTGTLVPATHHMQLSFSSNETCSGLPHEKRVHIDFSCDRSRGLGRPIKLLTQYCLTTFNWPTIVACSTFKTHPILSKCFVYDNDGQLRDLSHLIAPDGHVVSSPDQHAVGQYVINICSEVNQSCHSPKSSPSGTSVCVRHSNRQIEHLGHIRKTDLTYDGRSDEVVVKYYSASKLPTCPNAAFMTLIRLRCPRTRADFSYYGLESRKPFVLQKNDCELVIEWQTDYACPTHVYESHISTQSCGIRIDGTFLDLKPLTRNESYLIANVSSGNETLDIAVNVCEGLNSRRFEYCQKSDWPSDAVCMRSSSRGTILIGSLHGAKLIYADGRVFLSYPVRQEFSCSGQSQMVFITFVCDASIGNGQPSFTSFSDCVLSIEWRTSRVCLPAHMQPPSCSVQSESGPLYDLSPLRRKMNETMWPVSLADYHPPHDHIPGENISLNVCGAVSKPENTTGSTTSCDRSSVYLNDGANSSLSLGCFTSPPVLHPVSQKLMLLYNVTHDLPAGGKNLVTSTILFSCAPGNVESVPKLTNVSVHVVSSHENRTDYTFEWSTGAACPLSRSYGSDCVVVDRNLGLKFDLNPLHEELHDIEMRQGQFKYYMNICGKVKSDFCKEENVGICRVNETGASMSLGQFSRNVTYWNGVLTLQYENGTALQANAASETRSSVISLVCDENDSREPEMISEQNDRHMFRMYTKHACPDMENLFPCVWLNETHAVDLSSLANATDNHFQALFDSESHTSTVYYYSFCRPLTRVNHEESNCREGSAACKVTMRNGKVVSALSMGIPRDGPALYFGHDYLSLIYTNGDVCPSNESLRMSFVIKFLCDEDEGDGLGQDRSIRPISDGCGEEIEFHTALVCDVFPAAPSAISAHTSPPDVQSKQAPVSVFALIVMLVLVLVAGAMAAVTLITKAENRSRIIGRLRSIVCRDLIPSNPIHYSQLQSSGRDPLAFVSTGSSSPSPYNSTTMSLSDAPANPLIMTRLSRPRDSRDSCEDTVQLI